MTAYYGDKYADFDGGERSSMSNGDNGHIGSTEKGTSVGELPHAVMVILSGSDEDITDFSVTVYSCRG